MSIMVCMEYPLTFSISSCDHTTTFLGILFSPFCLTNPLACISLFISFIFTSRPSLLFSLHSIFTLVLSSTFILFCIVHCHHHFVFASHLLHTHFTFVSICKLVFIAITLCSLCCWFLFANSPYYHHRLFVN